MATLQEIQASSKAKRAANATNVPADTTVNAPRITFTQPESTPTYVQTSSGKTGADGNFQVEGMSATYTDGSGNTTYGAPSIQSGQKLSSSTTSSSTGGSSTGAPSSSTNSNTNGGVNNGTQGNKSTVAGGVNPNATDEAIVNNVKKQATNTYNDNVSIDKKQLEDTKKTTTDVYDKQAAAMGERSMNITLESSEEDLRQKKRAADDALILQNAQEKERAEQVANIAYVEAQNKANENDAKIAEDVALQQSNVAMAKLGLTLSTAGITQAQQIFTQGAYKIAELKTRNAYNVAELKNDVAKVEFDHTNAVNTIIRESENKSYDIRSKLSKDVYDIKSNITLNKLAKQEALNKAIDDYQKSRDDNEMIILAKMTGAYKTQESRVDSIYNIIKTQEKYANDKVNTYVASGQWAALPPSEKVRLEKEAGLATGTIDKQIRSSITTTITKAMDGLPLTSSGLANIQVEALRLFDMGIGMEAAVASALQASPEYQAALKKKNAPKATGAKSSKYKYVDTVQAADGKWYKRYSDPDTGKVIDELSDNQYNDGGRLPTLDTDKGDGVPTWNAVTGQFEYK